MRYNRYRFCPAAQNYLHVHFSQWGALSPNHQCENMTRWRRHRRQMNWNIWPPTGFSVVLMILFEERFISSSESISLNDLVETVNQRILYCQRFWPTDSIRNSIRSIRSRVVAIFYPASRISFGAFAGLGACGKLALVELRRGAIARALCCQVKDSGVSPMSTGNIDHQGWLVYILM